MADYLDEIVGQDTAKRFLRTAIKKENLYNFLFIGPKGVGKRLLGFALAKTIGCPPSSPYFMLVGPVISKVKDKPDKVYEYLKRYLPENPMVEIEDRASILIDQVRVVIEKLGTMPALGSKRVVLIIEADKMTDEAANSFLKTLEEPPLDTVFILTSSRPNYLLPTIRSRCQVVPFYYLTNSQIKEIIYEGKDEYRLGSPGEILTLKENSLFEKAFSIFKSSPLPLSAAAKAARELERQKLMDLFYPLMLLYRLVLYRQLGMNTESPHEQEISDKAKKVPQERILNAVAMLNYCMNLLEQNPNRLLLLSNMLLKLP